MKLKFLLLFLFSLIAFNFAVSQEKEWINPKTLSQEDLERIYGDIFRPGKIYKVAGSQREIKQVIINGNKVKTVLYNYGSICKPNTLSEVADLVWQGLGYGFEFGPLAVAQVVNSNNLGGFDTLIISDDSFVLTTEGQYSPDGSIKWGWLPKPGFADPNQNEVATLNALDRNGDGKPDSWPERWYSPGAGKYLWPAFLGDQATAPDEEVYFVMDDYTNAEFPYYPFPSDSSKRGLGLDAEVRILQFNNPLAEDIIFLIYQMTNASEKDLNRIYFGMHGDPHVGGFSDFNDDRAYFIPPLGPLADPYPQRSRNMVYAWDNDFRGIGGRRPGYFGWKFLESPSNSSDNFDNDDDGIIDDSPFNSAGIYIDGVGVPLTYGIADVAKYTVLFGAPRARWEGDEDGDWDIEKDDIGIDGIGPDSPNYPGADYGEGDGKPSQGWYQDVNDNLIYDFGEPVSDERLDGFLWAGSEPNFGLRDISESDQIGLTSFHAAAYGSNNVPKDESLMWEWLSSETIDPNQTLLNEPGDNIFNFGTGPLRLRQKEGQRFSMAILFGETLDDLVFNAETSSRVLESDYRFAKPPDKPVVTAVPGDGRVTLYWDSGAEDSYDPFTSSNDFQGYKIYRSRDFTFSDVYTITDANGIPFLGQALFDPNTGRRAQFDLVDSLFGFHPVEYLGRAVKYYLGNNSGLVHEYVDSTVMNGVTYYYAVVAYDAGSIRFALPPSETQSVIQRDPITGALVFDVNTAMVTPNPLGSGIKGAEAGTGGVPMRVTGNSTGEIRIKVLNDLAVENKIFKLTFHDPETYSLLDSTGVEDFFTSKDTVFVFLKKRNINEETFRLFDAANNLVDPSRYFLNAEAGRIRGVGNGLPAGEKFKATYNYYPVLRSSYINGEDANNSFEGLRVYVNNDTLGLDKVNSGWIRSESNIRDSLKFPPRAGTPVLYRADWEIVWTGLDTLPNGQWANPGDTLPTNLGAVRVIAPFRIINVTENVPGLAIAFVESNAPNLSRWKFGQSLFLRPQNGTGSQVSYQVDFIVPSNPIYPKSGDVYAVKTTKPFRTGDTYIFNTQKAEFNSESASATMDNIYVVPNPYVAYSFSENPGATSSQRGERNLQFRNLPPECNIRIFTVTGELVHTIRKDDTGSIATWDLLSNEGQRIAYGVYIYHVDAPGVGEKIGRFAVIK
jgi:hypothetical protein